jgi:signal transduction histidine kinase
MRSAVLPARAAGRPAAARGQAAAPRWASAILGVPLAAKLAGANAVIVVAALAAAYGLRAGSDQGRMVAVMGVALGVSLLVNLALVHVALRPLQTLEDAAARVYGGDLNTRVTPSPLADREMARVGGAINLLLDSLAADRARARQLASEVIRAGEQERAYLARELHDSAAQTLAAVVFQLSAAARDSTDPAVAARLDGIKAMAVQVLEEVRMLAGAVHPRVLDDLGLPAALRAAARQAAEHHEMEVTVVADVDRTDVPPAVASVLYRVAQEALKNALRHAHAHEVNLRLARQNGRIVLDVVDDGAGFDVAEAERRRPGMGLFTMRQRVALLDGEFDVVSRPGQGTRITAAVPLERRENEGGDRDR